MGKSNQRKRRRRTRESSAALASSSESDGGGSGSEDERDESEKQERRWQLRRSTLDSKGKGKQLLKEDDDDDEEEEEEGDERSRSSIGGDSANEGHGEEQFLQADGSERHPDSKGATPQEEICGICLSEGGNERGKLDCCDHFFCFACIMEWSKVESRCPMCKQRFITVMRPAAPGVTRSRTRSVRIPTRDQVYVPSEEEIRLFTDPYQNTVCTECQEAGDEGLLLLCDRCDAAAHTYCVGLGRSVPRGDWYCQACQSLCQDSSGDEDDEEDATFNTSDMEEEEGSGTESILAMIVGDVHPNLFAGRTRRSAASQGVVPLRRSTRRRGRRNSLSESTVVADPYISIAATPPRLGFFPPLMETHSARTLSHQRQVQATVQNRLQNMRDNWNRYRSGEVQFSSLGHSAESSRPGSAAGGSSTPRLGYGSRSTSATTIVVDAPRNASHATRGAGRDGEAGDLDRAWVNMDRAIRLEGSTASPSQPCVPSRVSSSTDRKGGEARPMGTPVSARTRERSHQADVIARANSSRGPLVERNAPAENYVRADSSRGTRDERRSHTDSHHSKSNSGRGRIDLFSGRSSSNCRDFDLRESSQLALTARPSENRHMEILGGGENSRSGYLLRESNRQHIYRTGNNPKDSSVTIGSAKSPTSILDEKDSSRGSGGVSTRRFAREAKEMHCSNVQSILDDSSRGSVGVMTRWRDAQAVNGRCALDDRDNSNSTWRGATRRETDRNRSKSHVQDSGQSMSRNPSRDGEVKAMKEQCFSLVQIALKPSLEKGAIDKVQFKELARSATHTILSSLGVPGLKHGTDVVALGTICCDHEQPTSSSLIPGCCTTCVQRHVKRYVKSLVKAKSAFA